MGIIQKYKDWRKHKWLEKLKGGLQMLRNEITFDPRYALNIDEIDTAQAFTRRIEEYRIWYIGVGRLLRQLYNQSIKEESLNYFWYAALNDTRMIHSGIPGLISSKMATILFGSGVNVETLVYNEDGSVDEAKSEQVQDLMDNLIQIVKLAEKMTKAAQTESWSGHVFFKLSHKVSLSNYPILEVASIRDTEVVEERGIITAYVFKHWYEHNKVQYRLDEVYTTNKDGDATIRYELYALKNGEAIPTDLNDIPQTSTLRDTMNLNENDEFVYTGLKGMLAFGKPNKTPSHEFANSPYGASDYEGALDSFDALDEALSGLIAELRDNRTIRYIPETMIPKIARETRDGQIFMESILPNKFTTNYVKVEGSQDQDFKNQLTIQHIPDKTEENLKKYQTALTTAINQAGISAFALGITGLESINSSAESQQERNKVTLETRGVKLEIWQPFLENFLEMLLMLNSWMQQNTTARQEAFAKLELDFENLDVKVLFGDYIIDKISDRITVWGGAKSTGVASTYMAVSKIHNDFDDEQVLEEVNRIKFEQGMSLDDPTNLPKLDGKEENDELEKLEEQGNERTGS